MLLPPSLEELIEDHHPVRVVNDVVDRIDITPIMQQYKPGGTSVYHPRMMLKVLIYAYLSNIFSSRKMEAALKENIHFMWLSAMNKPDHNTLARFRSERLKGVLRLIFGQVVELLMEEGLVDIKQLYTDGTKMEAYANKYTFVWGKTVKKNKESIEAQLDELWDYTQRVTEEELGEEKPDFREVDGQKVRSTVEKIDRVLKGKKVSKKVKNQLSRARKEWPEKLVEYREKEAILGERNSYSKTDSDATFMRTKDDVLKNGQLKACYNWQLSTSGQFIAHYSIHQNPGDTLTLKSHLEGFKQLYNQIPETVCADAGYGSQENYEYLEKEQIIPYVKYNYFHKEQSKKWKQDPFRTDNLYYNSQTDTVYCPMGQPMHRIEDHISYSRNGYRQVSARYQAKNCDACPLRGPCFKGKGNRMVSINHQLRRYKAKARQLLESEKGIMHRKKRGVEVEAVFGMVKHNRGFRRFMLKGLEKVEIETGLLAIAHNLAKKAAWIGTSLFS